MRAHLASSREFFRVSFSRPPSPQPPVLRRFTASSAAAPDYAFMRRKAFPCIFFACISFQSRPMPGARSGLRRLVAAIAYRDGLRVALPPLPCPIHSRCKKILLPAESPQPSAAPSLAPIFRLPALCIPFTACIKRPREHWLHSAATRQFDQFAREQRQRICINCIDAQAGRFIGAVKPQLQRLFGQ
jgi:hypothetical protein